jgi:hypothetical protein
MAAAYNAKAAVEKISRASPLIAGLPYLNFSARYFGEHFWAHHNFWDGWHVSNAPVPEGLLRIARRFNAGTGPAAIRVPKGRLNLDSGSAVPSGLG